MYGAIHELLYEHPLHVLLRRRKSPKRLRVGEEEQQEYVKVKSERLGFTAITDGQMQHINTFEVKVIVECKKDPRSSCAPAVDMYEAAQMLAWIMQYPPRVLQ